MATAANLEDQIRTIDPDEERAFMDAIDRWLEREVIPVIQHHDHGDIWPEKLAARSRESSQEEGGGGRRR